MKFNYGPLQDLFGYSRRERRASLILLFIILIVSSVKYFFPMHRDEIIEITNAYPASDGRMLHKESPSPGISRTRFDPNTATYRELIAAGLADRQARTLISYRNSGGIFREKEDIAKVYGISGEKADSLEPFIKIEVDSNRKRDTIHQERRRVSEPFDLNTCDSAKLEMLPGIGPVLAGRIIKFRKLLGGYYSVEQLKEVYGLPAGTYDRICKMVIADTGMISRISINSADYMTLSKLIYLGRYEINAILGYRRLMDSIKSIKELVENNIITKEKAEKVSHYISFE